MQWLTQVFRRRKLYDDLDEEIREHLEEKTEQFMREGMDKKAAEQAAHRAFGNSTVTIIHLTQNIDKTMIMLP